MNPIKEILTFYKEIGASFVERFEADPVMDIGAVRGEILRCTRCHLHETKKNYVPGEGCLNPDILFIGEAPGETEDSFGKPFIGNAGQLLDRMITRMGYTRETVFIANIIKCRPPNNRDPLVEEVAACKPFIISQIQIIKPRIIVCLGRVALNNLLDHPFQITHERGKLHEFMGIPVIPTFHPAYILRQKTQEAITKAKWETWHDMETVLGLLKKGVNRP
jgi:uracil-DNA glycosylase